MMEKRHRKISLIVVLLAMLLIASLSFVACTKSSYEVKLERSAISLEIGESYEIVYQVTKNGDIDTESAVAVSVKGDSVTYSAETNKITAVKTGKAEVTVSLKSDSKVSAKLTVSVPEYEIELKGNSSENADLGGEDIIEYTVLKDGTKVTDKKVVITVEGDAVKYEKVGNRIYFVKVGSATVKAALESDPSVYAEKTYNVVKSFWNSGDHQVNKDMMTITDDSVYMPGGSAAQYFLGVLDGGTKYVFKTKLTIPAAASLGSQTVGVTHDKDRNNAGLWFGVNSPNGNNYRIYIKNFFGGWPGQDYVKYENVEFSSETIEFIIVRDGNNFWYSIDGYCGTYTMPASGSNTISAETETWAGIFSQERKLTATEFSYSVEEEDITAAKTACESPVARFEITNKGVNQLVKGTSFTYTAKVVATDPSNVPAVVWDIDKSAMTGGADGTTMTDGLLSLAMDAEGVVTVVATCGGKEVRFDVNIRSESLAAENDVVKVDGGVELGEDGTVTFTEEYNYNNTNLSDTEYSEIYYAATLKNTVKGDFELAFTLTELKSDSTPKFMVSLGNSLGNFIFTGNSVSVKAQCVDTASKEYAQGTATATFTAADTLEVVIKVVGGHYKVTVNGTELTFTGKDPVRNTEDYGAARPVLFTTGAGTSVKVSAITLTDKADAQFIVLNDYSQLTADGFETDVVTLSWGWDAKDKSINKVFYPELLPAGDYTISMNVTFNTALSDGKLSINIGGTDFYVNNKISGGAVVGQWGNFSGETNTNVKQAGTFKVELKKIGNDMYFYIGNTRIADKYDVTGLGRNLCFWAANFAGSSNGSTAKVSDFTVTEGATIITINGDSAVQVGNSATYSVTVLGGNEDGVVWALNKDGLTAGASGTSFDASTRKLTLANDAAGTVVLTATLNGVTAEITISASSQPANQNTALAESIGGVKQDVANKTLIFDDAAANGVAAEDRYSEASGYYAILNTAAGTRATIQDNFVLEFTVSDYVTTAQYPKLMISLGGKFEQFYVAYTTGGARIEAFLMDFNGNSNMGRWVNSDNFASYDTSVSHTFKLVCEDGIYKVYVDGTLATFPSEIFRSVDSMAFGRNVMFSTNAGTTATVSNVSLKAVDGKAGKVTATYSNSFTANPDGSITATFDTLSGRDNFHNPKVVYTYGAYIPDDCEITLSVTYDNGNDYDDDAVVIRFGSDRSFAVVMNNGSAKIEQQWTWGGMSVNDNNRIFNNTVKIKITVAGGYVTAVRAMEHDASGNETGWSTDTVAMNGGYADDQKVNGFLSFGIFNQGVAKGNTMTISNISVVNS